MGIKLNWYIIICYTSFTSGLVYATLRVHQVGKCTSFDSTQDAMSAARHGYVPANFVTMDYEHHNRISVPCAAHMHTAHKRGVG